MAQRYVLYAKRGLGGTAAVLIPSCCYVAYKYRPRASFDVDYHESLVRGRTAPRAGGARAAPGRQMAVRHRAPRLALVQASTS